MLNSQIIRNQFGHFFIIHTSKCKPAPATLLPEPIHNLTQAKSFINKLIVPINFWRDIYHTTSIINNQISNDIQLIDALAELFSHGKITAYKIDPPSPSGPRTIATDDGLSFTFSALNTLLTSAPSIVKPFDTNKSAEDFLTKLNMDTDQLELISSELKINSPVTSIAGNRNLISQMSESLVQGSIVVTVERRTSAPRTEELIAATGPGNKMAGLGPDNNEEPSYDISTVIKAEYKVVLFDKELSAFQNETEELIHADPTYIELSLESTGIPYDQGAKQSCTPANVEFFTNWDTRLIRLLKYTLAVFQIIHTNTIKMGRTVIIRT